ncbi:hypothetical protein A2442_03745 [Candidatus Campbellbacteria bacterium RIFOXYC2_FULL_35_25]|uniref:Uncharacterized protein n=1 Tax=Candidatus Campbellbacteria bacterium RIFOXYC2_FULL_35_25 TaxID=1797582 RepID=A0A1F5EJQ2_9BACT|nr:MAG: hypothetical protein A2442_03745 [Candidatus Campbellbacteria bacterium RIFOXYC2_FULL_35_25]
MSTKNTRSGGKYCNSHTTVIPAAGTVVDIANELSEVTKIQIGFIKAGLKSANGQKRVKIGDIGSNIMLSIRDNTTVQEIIVYSNDSQKTKLAVAQGSRNAGLHVSFGPH